MAYAEQPLAVRRVRAESRRTMPREQRRFLATLVALEWRMAARSLVSSGKSKGITVRPAVSRAARSHSARASVLPALAEWFIERGRAVAALACIEEAVGLGIAPDRVQDTKKKALSGPGSAYQAFRDPVAKA